MTKKIRGKIIVIAKAISPIMHGGDTVGNVRQVRRKGVYNKDGVWQVPYISGNSIKHIIRENAARFALDALNIEGGLSKSEVQLLISGGAMTKTGQSVRLDAARKAEELFPALSLCGYSAGNTMTESQVRVDHWELVCAENKDRLQHIINEYAPEYAYLLEQYSSDFVQTNFGTRHETTRRRTNRELLTEDDRKAVEKEISDRMTKSGDKGDSLQMYYEFETLSAGALFVGGFSFPYGVTENELAAFKSAFTYASEGTDGDGTLVIAIGGNSSTGQGKVSLQLHGMLAEGIEAKTYTKTNELAPDVSKLQPYVQFLKDNQDDVKSAIGELAG